jgi:hypothetical protein
MFASTLLGVSLVLQSLLLPVSVRPGMIDTDLQPELSARLSDDQKEAVMAPLIRVTTDCVCRTVAADPRLGAINVGDLIVDSFSSCLAPVRALIDTHDRMFGEGTGQRFFMGPYLDELPSTVSLYVAQRKN